MQEQISKNAVLIVIGVVFVFLATLAVTLAAQSQSENNSCKSNNHKFERYNSAPPRYR
jgi:uncharacterized membrane protein